MVLYYEFKEEARITMIKRLLFDDNYDSCNSIRLWPKFINVIFSINLNPNNLLDFSNFNSI